MHIVDTTIDVWRMMKEVQEVTMYLCQPMIDQSSMWILQESVVYEYVWYIYLLDIDVTGAKMELGVDYQWENTKPKDNKYRYFGQIIEKDLEGKEADTLLT